eukprot:1353529-Prymnesium_polylepis.1
MAPCRKTDRTPPVCIFPGERLLLPLRRIGSGAVGVWPAEDLSVGLDDRRLGAETLPRLARSCVERRLGPAPLLVMRLHPRLLGVRRAARERRRQRVRLRVESAALATHWHRAVRGCRVRFRAGAAQCEAAGESVKSVGGGGAGSAAAARSGARASAESVPQG